MEQGMRQNMVATAAMQMFMRTLQATNTELAQIASQAIAANPALEELPPPHRDESDEGDERGGRDRAADRTRHDASGENDTPSLDRAATQRHSAFLENISEPVTLAEHLSEQVRQSALPAPLAELCLQLIDRLDHRGYFSETREQTERELRASRPLFERALATLQDLDPAGVGAFSLQESLILQLLRADEGDSLAMRLLRERWDDLVRHRYAEAARALGESEEAVAGAARRIARLNPDPGSIFNRAEEHVITPDLIVRLENGQPVVQLTNEGLPRLGLSAAYRDMLAERADDTDLRRYLSRCFRGGRELIKAISDRQQTILSVAQAIVRRQKPFFTDGPAALRPLRMEDIAQDTGLHLSTVSRAAKGKYLQCDHGVYELRRFFTAALPAGNEGESVSAGAVQARLRELIRSEDPRKPLSDAKLEAALAAEGISVARRTIAKYREQLHILPASLRRQN